MVSIVNRPVRRAPCAGGGDDEIDATSPFAKNHDEADGAGYRRGLGSGLIPNRGAVIPLAAAASVSRTARKCGYDHPVRSSDENEGIHADGGVAAMTGAGPLARLLFALYRPPGGQW